MSKKKTPTYYHDQIILSPSQLETRTGASTHVLETYLHDALNKISRALNTASANGDIDTLVNRYLNGDTYLTKDTQEAREAYSKIIPDAILPSIAKRRWLDIAASRIKDILKEEATKKKTSKLIQENPELNDSDIAKLFWSEKKVGAIPRGVRAPKSYEVARIRSATQKLNGASWVTAPNFGAKLPLSKADQISEVQRVKGGFVLRINPDGAFRKSEYHYALPKNNDRFATGKICKPDVLLDESGNVKLIFAVRHKAPTPYEPQCDIPVDLGILLPFTACAMTSEYRSQIVYPNDEIMSEVRKLERLVEQRSNLLRKSAENMRVGRSERLRALGEAQAVEAGFLASRVSVVKSRVADLVAHRVVGMAFSLRGRIVLEELSWSVPSHAFFQSLLQENIVGLAVRCGVPVVWVGAAGTSRDCPVCGEELSQGRVVSSPVCVPVPGGGVQVPERVARGVVCFGCGFEGHHDGVSPYNMGERSLGCGSPGRFVRVRFGDVCWSGLPLGWRRAPQRLLCPFDFESQVLAFQSRDGSG